MQLRPEMIPILAMIALVFCGLMVLLFLTFLGAVFRIGPCQYHFVTRERRSPYINEPKFTDTRPLPAVAETVVLSKRIDSTERVVLDGN